LPLPIFGAAIGGGHGPLGPPPAYAIGVTEAIVLYHHGLEAYSSNFTFVSTSRSKIPAQEANKYVVSLSRHCHVTPRNAVIGCNNFTSWIFSNMFESLQLLQRIVCKNCMRLLHMKPLL